MARQTSVRGNFLMILRKAIQDGFTGRLVFMGKEGGVVRVTLIKGQVKQIDSTWGFGKSELEKLKVWGSGLCLIKSLTTAEREKFSGMPPIDIFGNASPVKSENAKENKAQRTEVEKPSGTTAGKTTKILPYRVLDGGPAVLDEILEDIGREELSGYLKVKPHDSIMVFFRGKVLGAFENLPPAPEISLYDIIHQLHNPENQILFYNLREDYARALTTLFYNRVIYAGIPQSKVTLQEMLAIAKERKLNGVLWMDESHLLIQLEEGKPQFAVMIEDFWRLIPIPRTGVDNSRLYLFESLPDEELLQKATLIIDREDLEKLINSWLSLNRAIVDKLGKKMARGIMKKLLQDENLSRFFVEKDGIIKPVPGTKVSAYVLMEYIMEIVDRLFRDAKGFIGGDWLEKKLREFYRKERELLDTIGLSERIKKLWTHSE